jgi:hypothetical protein
MLNRQVAFGGKRTSIGRQDRPVRSRMTLNGHHPIRPYRCSAICNVWLASSLSLRVGWSHAPARFHKSFCWLSSHVAACDARPATGADASRGRADGLRRQRPAGAGAQCGIPAEAAAIYERQLAANEYMGASRACRSHPSNSRSQSHRGYPGNGATIGTVLSVTTNVVSNQPS